MVAKLKKEKEELYKKVGEMRLKLEKAKLIGKNEMKNNNDSCTDKQNSVKQQKIFGRQQSPVYTSQEIKSKKDNQIMKTMRSEMKLKIYDYSLTDEYYKYYQNMEITSPTSYRPDIDQ